MCRKMTGMSTPAESTPSETLVRRVLLALVVPAAGLAALIVFLATWGPDWPAAEFRAWLARHVGFTVWSNAWFSGDSLFGYSALFQFAGYAVGALFSGLIAVALASYAAIGLAPRDALWRAVGFHVSVTVVLLASLLVGQVPFLLGVALALLAVRVLVGGNGFVALLLALVCSLVSPLAGAFLVVAAPGAAIAAGSVRQAVPLLFAVVGPTAAVVMAGVGGDVRFPTPAFVEIVVFCALALLLVRERAVQVFALCYLAVTIAAFVVDNPVGGDAARLGQLIALPLVWHASSRLRFVGAQPRLVIAVTAVLAALTAAWQLVPTMSVSTQGADVASRHESYYAGVLRFLDRQDPRAGRLEVVPTREHWESYWVARDFPIARGPQRATDLRVAGVLYHPLTASSYRRWLDQHAVDLVALPDVPLDRGGRAEQALLQHPPSYLKPVYRDAHWRVWRVEHARPLVTGPARVRSIDTAALTLQFRRRGAAVVRIHSNGLWQTSGAHSCLTSTGRLHWLVVHAQRRGRVRLQAELSWSSLRGRSASRCQGQSGSVRRKSTKPAK